MPEDILRTKLYRPPVTGNLVARPRLLEHLHHHRQRPLTLVVAPAGYGKTTLISSWLESMDQPSAWLSLDEYDDDLGMFLSYFIGAVQTISPKACQNTQALLETPMPLPLSVLVRSLINELDQLASPLVLVMDDLHFIREPTIYDFLTELSRHPLPKLHLTLITRIDPPLNLSRLRTRNQVTEIRTHDLRFTPAEAATYLEQELGHQVDEQIFTSLMEQSEGWVASLRLLVLSLRNRGALSLVERPLLGQMAYLNDYLMAEVLEQLPPAIHKFLLKTAVLGRLCGSLCETVTGLDDLECNGQAYLEWLHQNNLFTTPLDDRREWYRYHHLFQELLQNQLAQKYSAAEIADLHRRASIWLAQNNWLDEALSHALAAGDTEAAIQLAARHRHRLIDREEWSRLHRWLRFFSEDTINQQAELLIIKAYLRGHQGQYAERMNILDQVESQMAQRLLAEDSANLIRGEIYMLRSDFAFNRGNLEEALTNATSALQSLPPGLHLVTNAAWFLAIASQHMLGDSKTAHKQLHRLLEKADFADRTRHETVLLYVSCLLCWVDADLSALAREAERYLKIGQQLDLPESIAMANGFLGAVHYQRNNLVAAERCFTLLNNSVHKVNKIWYTQGMLAQAKIYQIQGKPERAYETVEEARANLLGLQSSQLLSLLEGFLVDMNLNESHLAEANRWAKQYNPLPIMWMHRFYVPQFTLVKVWLAQDTEASREQTADLLAQLQAFYERTHNTRHLIEVLALQGLLERALGHKMAALDKLEQAVQLAELGGFIRLFVDLGPKIADLLKQLYSRDVTKDYLTQILAAFPPDSRLEEEKIANRKPVLSEAEVSEISQMPKRVQNLIEPLTERELEVLALLAQQFSNKEIADQLVIAPGTVKQHTHRIYQKLDVKSRWQAVEKAAELQLLSLN